MKLTRVLRDKVEKELDAKRHEINKQARADYEERREKAIKEIDYLIENTLKPSIEIILAKYGMDTNNIYNTQNCNIVKLYAYNVENIIEYKKLAQAEKDRYDKQEQLMEDFAIECELGVDKADFFEALANLCEKLGEEG